MTSYRLDPQFDADEFRREHWQKKPVLLPGLVPNFTDAISAEELAGLACEELAESRLVSSFEKGRYDLRNGPFAESDFTELPARDWTLLVQAVDQWVDEVASLKSLFEFIPNWRIDDVMTSFAAAGGSVGPHYDYYDVFLLQGSGSRDWRVGRRCQGSDELIPDSELSLLRNFEATNEFHLEPGDALYIPPRFAHWGVAASDSLCYSIGFRAPSMAEMIEGFSDFIIRDKDPGLRYEDTELPRGLRSGEIRPSQLDASYRQLIESLSDKEKFQAWFGCYVSQPRYPELIAAEEQEYAAAELDSLLRDGLSLQKNPSSRFSFIESGASVQLFVDGAMVRFPHAQTENVATVSACTAFSLEQTPGLLADPEMSELLRRLLNQGSLLVSE